jgi:hypothetical protein
VRASCHEKVIFVCYLAHFPDSSRVLIVFDIVNFLCHDNCLDWTVGFFEMINFAVKRFGKKNLQVAMDLSSNGKNDDEW